MYGYKRKRGSAYGGKYGSGSKRSRNSYGGRSFSASQYRGGGGSGARTGGFVGQEVKFLDMARVPTLITRDAYTNTQMDPTDVEGATYACGTLNPVHTGSTPFTRVGRNLVLKRITIKGILYRQGCEVLGDKTLVGHTVRMLLVQDTQTNNALLDADVTAAGILRANAQTASGVASAFIDLEHQRRFKILVDKTFTLNPASLLTASTATATNACGANRSFCIDKKLNIPVTYTGHGESQANTNNADISDNSLHLYMMDEAGEVTAQTGVASEDRIGVSYQARLRWVG